MNLLNLVYNKIGNNVSILIDYSDFQIQIYDKVYHYHPETSWEIKGISFNSPEKIEILFFISTNKKQKYITIILKKNYIYIDNIFKMKVTSNGFISEKVDSNLLFKLGLNPLGCKYIKDNFFFLNFEYFFKQLAEILSALI